MPEVCATDTVVALVDLHTSLQGSIRANGSVGLLLHCILLLSNDIFVSLYSVMYLYHGALTSLR